MSEWQKIRIGNLFNLEKGSLQSSKCILGDFDFITASNEWKKHNEYSHETEALIVAVAASGSLGRVHHVNGKFISSDLCFILTPKSPNKYPIDLEFYFYVFRSIREDLVKTTAAGTSKLAINRENFSNYELPYFDLNHQKSFCNKLNFLECKNTQLKANCDYQKTYLSLLRQQILQDAISGKLTADWRTENPNVEPASQLLKRIKAEKEKLIAEKKMKKEKPLPPISEGEKPFVLPVGWEWVRFGELLLDTFYGPRFAKEEYVTNGIPTIRTTDMKGGKINLKDPPRIKMHNEEKIQIYRLKKGDILITRTGSIGEYAVFDDDYLAFPSAYLIRCRLVLPEYDKYVSLLMASPLMQSHFGLNTQKGTKPNINAKVINTAPFPLPPNIEQKVIVAKIEKLLALIDQLETRIAESARQADWLMQTFLAEVFTSPSSDQ